MFQQGVRVVEEVQSEVGQRANGGSPVDGDVPLGQVPAARSYDDRCGAIGELVTGERVRSLLDELGFDGTARDLFEQVALADDFATFLTLPAYELID